MFFGHHISFSLWTFIWDELLNINNIWYFTIYLPTELRKSTKHNKTRIPKTILIFLGRRTWFLKHVNEQWKSLAHYTGIYTIHYLIIFLKLFKVSLIWFIFFKNARVVWCWYTCFSHDWICQPLPHNLPEIMTGFRLFDLFSIKILTHVFLTWLAL